MSPFGGGKVLILFSYIVFSPVFFKVPFHLGAILGKDPFHLGAIQRQWREIGDLVSSVRLVKPHKLTSEII